MPEAARTQSGTLLFYGNVYFQSINSVINIPYTVVCYSNMNILLSTTVNFLNNLQLIGNSSLNIQNSSTVQMNNLFTDLLFTK